MATRSQSAPPEAKDFFDVNGDRLVTSLDVLMVINYLNYLQYHGTPSGFGYHPDSPPEDYNVYYAYTSDGVMGLIETETITTGRAQNLTTRYEYYPISAGAGTSGQLERITYADGTPEASTVEYTYDDFGNVSSITEQVNSSTYRTTKFIYDKLNRLVEMTGPDPDDTGPDPEDIGPEQPLTVEYAYDAFGNQTRITQKNYDPLSATTTTHTACMYHDNRNRLTWSVEPHPDQDTSSCPATAPETWEQSEVQSTWPGRPATFHEYDGNGNLLAMTDPRGNRTDYVYDDLDRVVKVIGPLPFGDSLDKEIVGTRLVKFDEVSGDWVLASPQDANARPYTEYVYDNLGNLWSVTDALGNTIDYRYDEWNRSKSVTYPEVPDPENENTLTRPRTAYEYEDSPYGWITRVKDQKVDDTETVTTLRVTESQTDFLGRQQYVAETALDGVRPVTWYEYYADGALRSVTDAMQNRTTYEYDERARVETVKQPAVFDPVTELMKQPEIHYTYNWADQLLEVKDPLNRVTTTEYDLAGRVEQVISPDPDSYSTYRYDAVGNLVEKIDVLNDAENEGLRTTYGYDHLYRQQWTVDPEGNPTDISNAVFGYDLSNPAGAAHMTWHTYDLVGSMTGLTDPNGNTTTWTYDGSNRVYTESIEIDQTPYSRTFKYDAVGNQRETTDRRGWVTEYQYDDLYRTTGETWKEQGVVERHLAFVYDLVGNLTSASDILNSENQSATYQYLHDDLDRVTLAQADLASLASDVFFEYAYDEAGNRKTIESTIGGSLVGGLISDGTPDFVNTYGYDDLYRMTSVSQGRQVGGPVVAEKLVKFGYTAASELETVERYEDLHGTQLIVGSKYKYDDAGRLVELNHREDSPLDWNEQTGDPDSLAAYTWQYDAGNRLTNFENRLHPTENAVYGYDARDQLTSVTYPNAPPNDQSFNYDDNGNRDELMGYTPGADNRMLSDGTYTYEYDDEGNRKTRTKIATGDVTEYEWDHRNRLERITEHPSLGAPASKTIEYTYDVFDRRITKTVDMDGNDPTEHAYRDVYIYDGQHIALELRDDDADDSDSNGTDEAPALSHRYLHGPAVDQILADEQVTSTSTPGNVIWPLTDNQGTVRDLADYNEMLDKTAIVNHITYDPFGQITGEQHYELDGSEIDRDHEDAVDHIFGYTGRERDEETRDANGEGGLNYYRARYYDPATGGFIGQDPIGFDAGDANLYRYVGNGPTNATDPSGLQAGGFDGGGYVDRMFADLYHAFLSMFGGGGGRRIDPSQPRGPHNSQHVFAQEPGGGGMIGGAVRVTTFDLVPTEKHPNDYSKLGMQIGAECTGPFRPGYELVFGHDVLRENDRSRLLAAAELVVWVTASGEVLATRYGAPAVAGGRSGPTLYWHGSKDAVDDTMRHGLFVHDPGSGGKYWATTRGKKGRLTKFLIGGDRNVDSLVPFRTSSKGGFDAVYNLTPKEAGCFSRAWGPEYSWNPYQWYKGGFGQYYYQPGAVTWGQRGIELRRAGVITVIVVGGTWGGMEVTDWYQGR